MAEHRRQFNAKGSIRPGRGSSQRQDGKSGKCGRCGCPTANRGGTCTSCLNWQEVWSKYDGGGGETK